jgi:hypothetical protein
MGGRAGIPSSRSERPARLRRNTFFLKRKTGFSSPPRSCSWRRTDEIVFRPARKSTFSLHVVARKLPFSLRSPDQRYPFSSHRKVVSLRTSFILRNTSVWTKDGRGFSRRKYNHARTTKPGRPRASDPATAAPLSSPGTRSFPQLVAPPACLHFLLLLTSYSPNTRFFTSKSTNRRGIVDRHNKTP